MEFKEFLKEYKRMCSSYKYCSLCPIDKESRDCELQNNCGNMDFLSDVNAESIVEKWAKEHPVKTYESDFKDKINDLLKIFPNHKLRKFIEDTNINICDSFCVANFYFNGDTKKAKCDYFSNFNSCKDCWKREINGE